jgi:hypothetical protein
MNDSVFAPVFSPAGGSLYRSIFIRHFTAPLVLIAVFIVLILIFFIFLVRSKTDTAKVPSWSFYPFNKI